MHGDVEEPIPFKGHCRRFTSIKPIKKVIVKDRKNIHLCSFSIGLGDHHSYGFEVHGLNVYVVELKNPDHCKNLVNVLCSFLTS